MEQDKSDFQSKGQILDYFQAVTAFTFEDSIRFLDKHKWNINKALQELFADNVQEGGLTNSGTPIFTSLLIRQNNDQHLAEFLSSVENKTTTDPTTPDLIVMGETKRIGIVAHNNKKEELLECLRKHRDVLAKHKLYGTGTTGSIVEKELQIPVTKFESGPFGGDQQLGAKITKRELDILIFFIDPLDAHPHDADINALIRLSQVYGIVCATTAAAVDFIFTSKMMNDVHVRKVKLQAYKPK